MLQKIRSRIIPPALHSNQQSADESKRQMARIQLVKLLCRELKC